MGFLSCSHAVVQAYSNWKRRLKTTFSVFIWNAKHETDYRITITEYRIPLTLRCQRQILFLHQSPQVYQCIAHSSQSSINTHVRMICNLFEA